MSREGKAQTGFSPDLAEVGKGRNGLVEGTFASAELIVRFADATERDAHV